MRDDFADGLVVTGFQVLTFGLGPRRNEEYSPVGGQERVQDTMATAFVLARGWVGPANLPGTASAWYDEQLRPMFYNAYCNTQ